jgi:protein TonB
MKFLWAALGASVMAGSALAADIPPASNGDLPDTTCAYSGSPKTPEQRPTLLSYIGTVNGTLTDISVEQASGDPAQDSAALACVRHWRFDPTSEVGKRNIGRHRLNFGWGPVNGETVLHRIGIPHLCRNYYPPAVAAAHIGGKTIVRFTITAEGLVSDPVIVASSGNAELDEASLTCVHDWRYRPALKDGQPLAVPWKAEIVWRAPAPPDVSSLPVPLQ